MTDIELGLINTVKRHSGRQNLDCASSIYASLCIDPYNQRAYKHCITILRIDQLKQLVILMLCASSFVPTENVKTHFETLQENCHD